MSFSKAIVRYTIITGLVGGAACLVAGPDRLSALAAQTRGKINAEIDKHIEDPIALRSQLRSLEGQYPERIASVRGDLAELREQATQLKRELEVKIAEELRRPPDDHGHKKDDKKHSHGAHAHAHPHAAAAPAKKAKAAKPAAAPAKAKAAKAKPVKKAKTKAKAKSKPRPAARKAKKAKPAKKKKR